MGGVVAAATTAAVRYDFDQISRDANVLNAFDTAQLTALQGQLTAAQATRGQGFGAFDEKLNKLQSFVAQRLTGAFLAIAVPAIPEMTLPRSAKVVINMFEVTEAALLAADPKVIARFKAELNAQVTDKNSAYNVKGGNTKETADRWLAWLAAQGVA